VVKGFTLVASWGVLDLRWHGKAADTSRSQWVSVGRTIVDEHGTPDDGCWNGTKNQATGVKV